MAYYTFIVDIDKRVSQQCGRPRSSCHKKIINMTLNMSKMEINQTDCEKKHSRFRWIGVWVNCLFSMENILISFKQIFLLQTDVLNSQKGDGAMATCTRQSKNTLFYNHNIVLLCRFNLLELAVPMKVFGPASAIPCLAKNNDQIAIRLKRTWLPHIWLILLCLPYLDY